MNNFTANFANPGGERETLTEWLRRQQLAGAMPQQPMGPQIPQGMLSGGNINLTTRPRVPMLGGSTATVRSASSNIDGRETLYPTISDDGRVMSDDEALAQARSGRNLGTFDTPANATAYAKQLSAQQGRAQPAGGTPMSPRGGTAQGGLLSQLGGGLRDAGNGLRSAMPDDFRDRLGDMAMGWGMGRDFNDSIAKGNQVAFAGRQIRRKEAKEEAVLNATREAAIRAGLPPDVAATMSADDLSNFIGKDWQSRREQEIANAQANKTAKFLVAQGIMTPEMAANATPEMIQAGLQIYQAKQSREPKGPQVLSQGQKAFGQDNRLLYENPAAPDKPPPSVQEYEYAKSQGYKGSYQDFQLAMKGEGKPTVLSPGQRAFDSKTGGLQFENPPVPESYSLSPGQTRFEGGERVASIPAEQKPIGALSPGQQYFGADGKPAASVPPAPEKPNLVTLQPPVGSQGLSPRTFDLSKPEYRQAAEQYISQGWTEREGKGVSVSLGSPPSKSVFDSMAERTEDARAAARSLPSFATARQSLKDGTITGFAADQRLYLSKLGTLFGMPDEAVANTETFRAAMAPTVLALVKGLGAGTAISNADREFAEKAVGGNITLDADSIARLVDIGERASRERVTQHRSVLDKVYPDTPENAQPRALFDVQIPEMPKVAAPAPQPPIQPQAPDTPPQPGAIEEGYRFKGGNPADPNNWELVQ